jgi:TatD DNase family protein
MRVFDTHCHLGGEELLPVASSLARAAVEGGVMGMTLIAADFPSLRALPELETKLRAENPGAIIVHSAGIHPHESKAVHEGEWQEIVEHSKTAVAIGETGLDFYYNHSDRKAQIELFDRHIDLACESQKPLVIHCREASKEVLELLETPRVRNHPNPGILHCFTEDWAVAQRLLDLNFFISFSGILSFRNAENLREVAKKIPLSNLLIETDSPWLAPIPHRGQRNQPLYVTHVFDTLVSLRPQNDAHSLETALWENSLRVFSQTELRAGARS